MVTNQDRILAHLVIQDSELQIELVVRPYLAVGRYHGLAIIIYSNILKNNKLMYSNSTETFAVSNVVSYSIKIS
jgi:hypothetical protein